MKLFVFGDLHADEELRDASIEEANSSDYDLAIAVGDFENPEYYLEFVNSIETEFIALTGNWDFHFEPPGNEEYERLFNYKEVVFEEYRIVLIGSIYPDDLRKTVGEFFEGVPHEYRIVASHYPPHMLGDLTRSGTRAGFELFREIIMREKPLLWACGHIHEDFGEFSLMNTTVLNVAAKESGKAFSLELSDDGIEEIEEVVLVPS